MFWNFYKKVFEALIGDNVVKSHDCFWNLFFDFEEALTSLRYTDFYQILKFTYVDNNPKDPLPVKFTKVVSLRKLADGNCLQCNWLSFNVFPLEYKLTSIIT